MKNSSTEVMSPCPQGECEEDSTELKLHGHETNHSLQNEEEKDLREKSKLRKKEHISHQRHETFKLQTI